MGKLPYGPATRHIKESYGGDSDPMKHYCTQYATKYGQHFSKLEQRVGRHTGTGYSSNFRPGVYYSGRLDQIDNPAMGRLVADNYSSVTQKSFRPYSAPTGNEPLPYSTAQTGSGYIRQKNLTIPSSAERPRSLVRTETHEKYTGVQRNASGGNVCFKSDGSGFTNNTNPEPITFLPDQAYRNDAPAYVTERPVGVAIYTTDYRALRIPRGDEALPNLTPKSNRDTGFTSGTRPRPGFVHRVMSDAYVKADDVPATRRARTRKQDPVEFINMTHPDNHSTVYKNTFLPGAAEATEAARLGAVQVGPKEQTGFCANPDVYVHTADHPARFVTHYQTRFVDRTPAGPDRQGHVWGGVQPQRPDGFTRSTGLHTAGPDHNPAAERAAMYPYVARSVVARDPFFDEHHFDHKIHKGEGAVCY